MSRDSTAPPPRPATVLEIVGDLDIASQDHFQSTLTETLATGSAIVDLSQLDFLAISALGSLVACQRTAARLDRRLVYAAAPPDARRLITLAELDEVLVQQPSVAAAWAYLSNAGAPAVDGDAPPLPVRRLMFRPAGRGEPGYQPLPQRAFTRPSSA